MEYQIPSSAAPVRALEAVSVSVERLEFTAIVGPSGCGKSSLIRVLSGLLQPTAGQVHIFHRRVVKPSVEIGVIFQHSTIFPWLSAIENVQFALRDNSRQGKEEQARALLALVGLRGFEFSLPNTLSGGMLQRLTLARALAANPAVLLLDEPFSALDAMSRSEMHALLEHVRKEKSLSALIVTHDFDEAVTLADRIVLMTPRPGRVAAEVTVSLARPRVTADGVRIDGFETVRNDIVRMAQQVFSLPQPS